MNHLRLKFLAILLMGLIILGVSGPLGLSKSLTVEAKSTQLSSFTSHEVPLISEKRRRNLNKIFQFDATPLKERVPVILLPGRAEEYQQSAWWKRFRNISKKQNHFEENFKLYAFIYDSKEELHRQVGDFVQEMNQAFGQLPPERKLVLISYSLGGVISRDAMDDPAIFDRVHTVIDIGVPFHGSPIFDPDWFTQYLRPKNHSPVRKYWDQLIYRMYLLKKTNLTRGLKWNNFDGSLPNFKREYRIEGDQVIAKLQPYYERPSTADIKKKTIVYASYMENDLTPKQPTSLNFPKILGHSTKIPKEIIGTVLPLYGSSTHAVFVYMNQQLMNLPSYSAYHPKEVNTHVYKFNDGVIPLSSALFLPGRDRPYDGSLEEMIQAIDVQKARLFVNIDHMHLGEYSIIKDKTQAGDILHPQDGRRTPNYWLLYDLQQLLPDLRQAQSQSREQPLTQEAEK